MFAWRSKFVNAVPVDARRVHLAARVAAGLVGLVCIASAQASTSAARNAKAGRAAVPWATISLGEPLSPPEVPQQAPFVAQAQGYFTKEHLHVKIVYMPNGLKSELGTTGGGIDIGMAGGVDSIAAAAQNAHIHAVWITYPRLDLLCIGAPSVTTIKDLVGKAVATTGPGGFAATTMEACLKQGGVSPSQVHEIAMTRAGFVPAMVNGRIQAATFHADDAYTVTHAIKGLHVLSYLAKSMPLYLNGTLNVTDAFGKAHKSVVVRTIAALMMADRWMMDPKNTTKFVKLVVGNSHESQAAVAYAIKTDRGLDFWNTNCAIPKKALTYTTRLLIAQKVITSAPTFSQIMDTSYCNQALALVNAAH